MQGPTYRYNEKTCRYERSSASAGSVISYGFSLLAVSLALLIGFLFLQDFLVNTEAEIALQKENAAMEKHSRVLRDQLDGVEMKLASLNEKDHILHQKFFSSILPASESDIAAHNETDILLADANDFRKTVKEIKSASDKLIQGSVQTSDGFGSLIKVKDYLTIIPSMPLISPVKNLEASNVLSGFGTRINPFHKGLYDHEGIDISAARGTEIIATASGSILTVRSSDLLAGYGNYIEIDHGNGFVTRYAHMEELRVRKGQKISKGSVIGTIGSSGGSVAPHLHYEIIRDGKNVNPVDYLIGETDAKTHSLLKSLSENVNQSLD
jgi:murein DD-endopeptidase MepM/ murein hydrolase activator NlpD